MKKGQYMLSLIIGVIVFFVCFAVAYLYMGYSMSDEESETPVAISRNEKSVSTVAEEAAIRIVPSTEIIMQVVDAKNKMIEKIDVASRTLLGLDEVEIGKRFSDYEITKFTEKEVVLTKKLEIDAKNDALSKVSTYHLGISGDHICIIPDEVGQDASIVKLNLQASDYSNSAYSLLLNGKITISADERQALINKPDEIEKILQVHDVK